jgi:hypothetical protein
MFMFGNISRVGAVILPSGGAGTHHRHMGPYSSRARASRRVRQDVRNSPFIAVSSSATSRAASRGLRGRLPRHFCARLNAEHGRRRSVGLAAASWDPRRPASVPRKNGFHCPLKILQSLRIPAPVLHQAIGSLDGEQLRLAFC